MKKLILGSMLTLAAGSGAAVASDRWKPKPPINLFHSINRGAAQLTAALLLDSITPASTIKSATVMAVEDNTSGANRDLRGLRALQHC
jgi:hypothetical protein